MTQEEFGNIRWDMDKQDAYCGCLVQTFYSLGLKFPIKKYVTSFLNADGAITGCVVHYELDDYTYTSIEGILSAVNAKRLGVNDVTWQLEYTTPTYYVYASTNVGGLVKGVSRKDGSLIYGYHGKKVHTAEQLLKIINK